MQREHEQLYEMMIEIRGYKPDREKKITDACRNEWSFREEDFSYEPDLDSRENVIRASAMGIIYTGEDEEAYSGRIMKAVWRMNGEPCTVKVHLKCWSKPDSCALISEEELEAS
jgi:hypothetical protein